MADCDDIILTYGRARDGDESAQSDLWRELRSHMLRVIRLKAADLQSSWAVEADDLYDVFLVELFQSEKSIRFDNAYHLTCYVEKALRRRTARTVRAATSVSCVRLWEMSEQETTAADFVERTTQRDELNAAFSILSSRERTICELFAAGYRWREIGQRLGLAADNVRMIFRLAIMRLRAEVSGGGSSDRDVAIQHRVSQSVVRLGSHCELRVLIAKLQRGYDTRPSSNASPRAHIARCNTAR